MDIQVVQELPLAVSRSEIELTSFSYVVLKEGGLLQSAISPLDATKPFSGI